MSFEKMFGKKMIEMYVFGVCESRWGPLESIKVECFTFLYSGFDFLVFRECFTND